MAFYYKVDLLSKCPIGLDEQKDLITADFFIPDLFSSLIFASSKLKNQGGKQMEKL